MCPDVFVNHNDNNDGLNIEIALPGVSQEEIKLTVGDHHFCISGGRDDLQFDGCYQLAHEIAKEKTTAKFENGLLQIGVPFIESIQGIDVAIE